MLFNFELVIFLKIIFMIDGFLNSEIHMDSDKFEKLIKEAAPFLPEPKETTIFSIGGRGYFENPTTDLLAFFFDPNQVHGFQDLLLRSFFTCMGVAESLELSEPPRREETTGNGKRIDLVLISEDWVLGIENKIKQGQQNPFEDYNEHLETQFPNKKIYRAILSPAGTRVHPSWTAVPYKDFVSEIFAQLGFYFRQSPLTKWSIFLREFLVHLENIATEKSMEEEQIAFVEKNYTTISALLELCNDNTFASYTALIAPNLAILVETC